MDHAAVLARIVQWAERDDNVRAVVVTGSVARGAVDALSDIDVELYVQRPEALLESTEWYEAFGEVLVVEALPNPWWHPTRLVHYVGGKVDFMIGSRRDLAGARYVRPFEVVVDKDGATGHLVRSEKEPRTPPSPGEFSECVHWFYAECLMEAKCLSRGELWMAKNRDAEAKALLLRMIEWDHRSRHGWAYDTWYLGTHWRQWMDADVVAALGRCWGRLDAPDSSAALVHTVELFGRLSVRTAALLELGSFDHQKVGDEVRRILVARGAGP